MMEIWETEAFVGLEKQAGVLKKQLEDVLKQMLEMLQPTEEEIREVVDSILDQGREVVEVECENLNYQIGELICLRQYRKEVEDEG